MPVNRRSGLAHDRCGIGGPAANLPARWPSRRCIGRPRLRSNTEPTPMRYGFYLPTRGPTATRDGVLALAREGERLGLHSAMVADHIVFPVESRSPYPYTVDGKHPSVGDALE